MSALIALIEPLVLPEEPNAQDAGGIPPIPGLQLGAPSEIEVEGWDSAPGAELRKHLEAWVASRCPDHLGLILKMTKNGFEALSSLLLGDEGAQKSKLYERHKPVRRLYQAVPPKLRLAVLKRDGYRCVKCGANRKDDTSVRLEVDHIMPGSQGGPATMENLQTLCFSCNQGKSDDDDGLVT